MDWTESSEAERSGEGKGNGQRRAKKGQKEHRGETGQSGKTREKPKERKRRINKVEKETRKQGRKKKEKHIKKCHSVNVRDQSMEPADDRGRMPTDAHVHHRNRQQRCRPKTRFNATTPHDVCVHLFKVNVGISSSTPAKH